MASPTYPESPTVARDGPSSILEARVLAVDGRRYTATVVTESEGRKYPDLPIATTYAHHERGEGGYVLPDVGSSCWVAIPGDGGTPFILAFRSVPRAVSSSEQDGQEPAEGDEISADHSMKRPQRRGGEFGWTSRDGAFLNFRRGGIVELGSKASCQRLYIPLGNFIRDICENYGQLTAAGVQYFDGGRSEGEDGTTAESYWRLMVKAHAADTQATVLVDVGSVEDQRFRVVVAPTSIKMSDGTWEVSGEKYHFYVDGDGNIEEKGSKISMEYTTLDLTVHGNRTESVEGDSSETVVGRKTISAPLGITLDGSVGGVGVLGNMTVSGSVTAAAVLAASIGGAGWPITIDVAWLTWLMSHVHPINLATPTITQPPIPPP